MNNRLIKKLSLGVVTLSAVVLLAACGDNGTIDDPATDPQQDPVEDPADPAVDPETDPADDTQQTDAPDTSNGIYGVEFAISLEDAVQTFHDTFGQDINISDVELDEDNGNYEYHISGWDEDNDYEIDIDATTGEVTDQETDNDTEADHTIDFDNIITPQEAMDNAVEASGSDFVDEWTLDEEGGLTVYEISIENGDDVTLDAATGSIIPDD